jgi:hypothetical protein
MRPLFQRCQPRYAPRRSLWINFSPTPRTARTSSSGAGHRGWRGARAEYARGRGARGGARGRVLTLTNRRMPFMVMMLRADFDFLKSSNRWKSPAGQFPIVGNPLAGKPIVGTFCTGLGKSFGDGRPELQVELAEIGVVKPIPLCPSVPSVVKRAGSNSGNTEVAPCEPLRPLWLILLSPDRRAPPVSSTGGGHRP